MKIIPRINIIKYTNDIDAGKEKYLWGKLWHLKLIKIGNMINTRRFNIFGLSVLLELNYRISNTTSKTLAEVLVFLKYE